MTTHCVCMKEERLCQQLCDVCRWGEIKRRGKGEERDAKTGRTPCLLSAVFCIGFSRENTGQNTKPA